MGSFLLRRGLATIPVILGIVLVVMLTLELVPGDPVEIMLGDHASETQVTEMRRQLGLDRPLAIRYVEYLGDVVRGDLGRSVRSNRPVLGEISNAWIKTIQLTVVAILLAIVVGVGLGATSALRPDGLLDALVRILALLGLSLPIFWTGLIFIYVFSYFLGLFPTGGTGSVRHIVLPAVTLALPSIALIARMTRSSLLEVLRDDYIRTANAKGLRMSVVVVRHALRNALIPIITITGLQFGQLMGGAILTETVFAWPGLGRLLVTAIGTRDYPLLQGAILLFALSFVVVNLLVDLAYGWLDPRIAHA